MNRQPNLQPVYLSPIDSWGSCLSETVRRYEQGKKYVLGRIEDMLREMIGNDEGISKFNAGGDNRQMTGAKTCRCTVIRL